MTDVAVAVHDRSGCLPGTIDRWAAVVESTLRAETVTRGSLDLIFVDEDEIAELNDVHMGQVGPTDVLAFPLDGADGQPGGDAVPIHLGDVVVCPAVAARQAPHHAGSVDAELHLLIVHGILHVLGHDHAEPAEAAAMIDRERHHLGRYNISHPSAR